MTRMTIRVRPWTWILTGCAVLVGVGALAGQAAPAEFWPAMQGGGDYPALAIQHPIAGAVMPSNFPAPMVLWTTKAGATDQFVAGFIAGERKWLFEGILPPWKPAEADWREIKQAAQGGGVELILAAYHADRPGELTARAKTRFRVSAETLSDPLFYREVNLPFSEAVKDPSKIRWRFGPLDEGTPPVVLENLPVCGNCHSFDRKGEHLAMDVDYANSKAAYVITRTAPEMRLATSDIISWDDYRREDGQQTFGLLSQISPDGRYVLSTVKDKSVFVPKPDLAFSQLFFPLRGILVTYDCDTKKFASLPGADDPAFVQSNPTWSPDGREVLFARNRAAELEKSRATGSILLTPDECEEFLKRGKAFRFDLYRVPFNGGEGGKAEPVRGASANGRSNYFPKFSPDGRWIVFCQASNYMLLQPDSELFIIPAAGGEARRLGCNLSRMNSWHSWSPDGKWMVFSSKAHSDYTQLYLTRISDQGEASPPVWLAHMVAPERAANIPEFVSLPRHGIVKIREQFLDDYSYTRAGNEFFRAGDVDQAIEKYRLALSLNPDNAMAHQRLGFLLFLVKHQPEEAMDHMRTAIRLEPHNPFAQYDLGFALSNRGDLTNAVVHLAEAVRLLPNGFDRNYSVPEMNLNLAQAYYRLRRFDECIRPIEAVLRVVPDHAHANHLMAMVKVLEGETDAAMPYFDQAVRAEPHLGDLPDFYDLLSRNYVKQGLYAEGFRMAEKACRLATAAGRAPQAARLQQRVDLCRKMLDAKGGN
jgi:tetratricopeptide (TPR) repeat protein